MVDEIADRLFEAIKHGDETHQAWLKGALHDFFVPLSPTRDEWPSDAEFQENDLVTTPREPFFAGRVCGWYRNSAGRLGFNVESTLIPKLIHNYPQSGLRAQGDQP